MDGDCAVADFEYNMKVQKKHQLENIQSENEEKKDRCGTSWAGGYDSTSADGGCHVHVTFQSEQCLSHHGQESL